MTTDADNRLLNLLRTNARASTAELARQLGVSRSTVQSRIERLERAGVIAGYTVRLAAAADRSRVRAHVLITAAPKLAQGILAGLGRIDSVRRVHSVSGSFDMIAILEAASVDELDKDIDAIGALDGVERTLSSIILSTRLER